MNTFDRPTINDFLAQLRVQTAKITRSFQDRKREIDSEFSSAGATSGSRHIIALLDAIDNHVENGVSVLLGELRRALDYPELNASELRSLTPPRLQEMVESIISSSGIARHQGRLQNAALGEDIAARLDQIPQHLTFWLRQFDIGWDAPIKPETLSAPPSDQ